jgi:LEA14-like dessication related protein
MMSRALAPLLPVLAVPAAAACALFGGLRFERPEVRLAAVRVVSLDLSGGRLDLVLRVYNPNRYDIRGRRVEARLALEGTDLGQAVLDDEVLLRSRDSVTVVVPSRFTWEGVGAGARALFSRGNAAYDLETVMFLRTPSGDRPVRFELHGTVDVVQMLR